MRSELGFGATFTAMTYLPHPTAVDPVFPTTVQQARFLADRDRGRPWPAAVRMLSAAVRVTGPLDVSFVRDALERLSARHAALRVRFERDGKNARRYTQRIVDATVELEVLDLSALRPEQRQAKFTADRERRAAFASGDGGLFRVKWFRFTAVEHVLVFFADPVIADCQSMDTLVGDYLSICGNDADRTAAEVPAAFASFLEFASWEAEALRSGYFQEAIDYWQGRWDRFAGARMAFEDFGRPPMPESPPIVGHGTAQLTLDGSTTQAIRRAAAPNHITPYTLMLAALAAVLARCARRSRVALWGSFSNRTPSTHDIVGCFRHRHLLGFEVWRQLSSRELLQQARTVVRQSVTHQGLPLEYLWHVAGYRPRYDDLVVSFDYTRWTPRSREVQFPHGAIAQRETLDEEAWEWTPTLAFHVEDRRDYFSLSVKYPEQCFAAAAMYDLLNQFRSVAGQLACDSNPSVEELLGQPGDWIEARAPAHPMAQLRPYDEASHL
jgi:hypothetical protein